MEVTAMEEEVLREKAKLLRDSIRRSQTIHREASAALTSIAGHMAAIDDAVLPAQARTNDASRVHDNVRRSLRTVGAMMSRLDLVQEAERVILNKPRKGLSAYLDAVDKLRSVEYCINLKSSYTTSNNVLKHVDELLSKATQELENDFRRLLSKCSKSLELECLFNSLPSLEQWLPLENISAGSINASSKESCGSLIDVNSAYTLPTLINPRYIPLLTKLFQKSVQLGCHQQFLKIYREFRGSTLELSLKCLGVEYVTTQEMQNAQAESLDAKIAQWTQFYRIVVKLLFAAERKLCDQIFEGKHTLKDNCFAGVTAKSLSTLLSFGEAVAKSQASPEKLFMLLDMYEATLELQSEVEVVFQGYACSKHRTSALNLTTCLASTIKRTFNDFKQNILKDSPNSTTADAAVHPLTSYVINYTKFLFDYQSSLKKIFEEFATGSGTNSDLVCQIMDVVHALETNLGSKSKQYKDHCLRHLFLMNNIHYIVRCIGSSEVNDLFGDDWVQKRRRIVQQHATQFRRVSWGKVKSLKAQCLQHRLASLATFLHNIVKIKRKTKLQALEFLSAQGLTSSLGLTRERNQRSGPIIGYYSSITSRSVIKERFKSFNIQFEEVCQRQMNWVIPDKELRDNLILAIAEILLPAYRNFLKRFGPLIGNSDSSSKYIKYTPEALEDALVNLFAKKRS